MTRVFEIRGRSEMMRSWGGCMRQHKRSTTGYSYTTSLVREEEVGKQRRHTNHWRTHTHIYMLRTPQIQCCSGYVVGVPYKRAIEYPLSSLEEDTGARVVARGGGLVVRSKMEIPTRRVGGYWRETCFLLFRPLSTTPPTTPVNRCG